MRIHQWCSVCVAVSLAAVAAAEPWLDLRIVTPMPDYVPDAHVVQVDDGPFTVELVVQVRLVDAPDAETLFALTPTLVTTGDEFEPFSDATLTFCERLGALDFECPLLNDTGGLDQFDVPDDWPGPAVEIPRYIDGVFVMYAINVFCQDDAGVEEGWTNVWKFAWTSDDPTPRTVTFAVGSEEAFLYRVEGDPHCRDSTGFGTAVAGSTFDLTIEPCDAGCPEPDPICVPEWDGNGVLDIRDLLAFLTDWYTGEIDRLSGQVITVSQLLRYLDYYRQGCPE